MGCFWVAGVLQGESYVLGMSSLCARVASVDSLDVLLLQGLGKTVTCMALILKTLGQPAAAPPGTAVHRGTDERGRRCGYYEVRESGGRPRLAAAGADALISTYDSFAAVDAPSESGHDAVCPTCATGETMLTGSC